MGKYDPLRNHLKRQRVADFELTFVEIERIIGYMLPNSAARPQWWANVEDPDVTHVQRNAWRDAGYDAFLIAGQDRVRFTGVRRPHVMRLIFRPEGVEPKPEEFSCMEFQSWDQIVRYLRVLEWPLDRQPWVLDGNMIVDPDTVLGHLSE